MGGTWIKPRVAFVCVSECSRGNRYRDDDRGRWRCGYGNRIQPGIDDREWNITRLVTQHANRGVDGNTLRALMLVARRFGRRGRTVVVAADRARQLAGRTHGRWPDEDQHEARRDPARKHRIHRNTHTP